VLSFLTSIPHKVREEIIVKKMKKYALMLVFIFLFNISYPNIEAMSIDNEEINELSENTEQTSGGEVMKTPDEEDDSNDVKSDSLSDFNDSESIPDQDVTEKYNMRSKLTNAYSQSIISSIENPINNQKLTGDFLIKGFAISMEKISKIEVYLDGVIKGQADYGISRSDIESKYSTYPDSGKSGFTYKFTGVSNGTHIIKTVATDSAGETQEQNVTIVVDNTKTMIMSKGTLNRNQMIKKLRERNATLSLKYISDFVDYTIDEANIEGVNYDILFSQMMHETGYLKFGGDVKPNQNNFAGLGATGNGVPGESFETVQIGIRAVVQHLKAYASNESLKQVCVDPRFKYVTRMSAIYVEHLGIQENPDGKGWAAARGYGYSLLTVKEDIAKVSSALDFSVINDVSINGNALEGNVLTVSIIATPANDTLYKVIVKDEDNKSTTLSDWSSSNTAKFTPIKAGKYTLTIYAKNKNSNSETNNDVVSKEITVSQGKSQVTSLSIIGDKYVGSTLTMKAEGTPAADTLYKLWVCDRSTGQWTVLSDYSTKNSAEFKPTKAGQYTFTVHVKHKSKSGTIEDDYRSVDVQVTTPKSQITSLNVTGDKYVGSTLTMKAEGTPAADTLYKLWVCDRSTGQWTVLSDYSTKNSVEFKPSKAGQYSFVVHAKHKSKSGTVEDDYKAVDVQVTTPKSQVTSLNVTGDKFVGSTLTMKAEGTPAADTLYKLWVCDRSTGQWTVLSDYSTKNSVEFKPTKAGQYTFTVHVKHKSKSGAIEDDYRSVDVQVVAVPKSQVKSLSVIGTPMVGSTLTMKAEGTPAADTLYKLWVCDRSTGQWTVLSDYSTKNSVEFKPTKVGQYSFVVHAKHKSKSGTVEDDYKAVDVQVTTPKSQITSLNVTGDKFVGSTLTMKAEGTPAADTLYKLWVCDRSTGQWTVLSDYSTKNSIEFKPTKAGQYTFTVHVKHKSKSGTIEDDYRSVDVQVTTPKSQVTSLNVTGDKFVGSTLTMKAEGTPAADTLYKLWVCDRSTGQWTVLSDYSTKNSIEFKPTKAGQYSFVVHVKHKSKSGTVEDDYKVVDVQVTTPKSTISSMNVVGNTELGNALTLNVEGTPATDTLYKLWVCDRSTDTWTVLSDWSTKNTIQYTPKKVGKYTYTVHVKHKNSGNIEEDSYMSQDFYITEKNKSMAVSLDVTGEMKKGKAINISSLAAPEKDTLYKIWICDRTTGKWTVLSDWSANRTATYTPESFGLFSVVVHFKHKNSANKDEDDYLSKDINIKGDKLIVIDPGHNQGGDYGAVSTHNGIKYSETDLNMEVSVKLKAELERRGYQVVMTRNQGEVSYLALRESLEKRVDLANNLNADLFISIHHNSFGDPTVRGVEVYYSTETPGSRGLLLKSGEEVSIQSKSAMISTRDVSKVSASRTLAENMVNNLSSRIGYKNRGAIDNDFYVVKNTLMPSVLVECGFISNPTEAAMVANQAIQQKVAEALASAVAGQF
jgi:N-acetylmuramoyl-L-alanine amidase